MESVKIFYDWLAEKGLVEEYKKAFLHTKEKDPEHHMYEENLPLFCAITLTINYSLNPCTDWCGYNYEFSVFCQNSAYENLTFSINDILVTKSKEQIAIQFARSCAC